MSRPAQLLALARRIDGERADELARRFGARTGSLEIARAVLLATAYPALEPALERDPSAAPAPVAKSRADLDALARPLRHERGEALRRSLRLLAQRERMRIALRELLPPSIGGAPFEQTARELSDLADVTIDLALDEARAHVTARFGHPRSASGEPGRLTVLGMGKLGGRELNAGSDVDLVCFYDSDEHVAVDADGREHDAHRVWTRVVRRMTENLADITEDGLVWRVDHRLRPEGARGPLVNSLAAAERYYETFGRLWERAAMLRARPVAGDRALGEEVLELLQPFVWTRRVDPSIALHMIDLVQRARREHPQRGEKRDLKLGPGGIREAEFFVQTLQLIWGGRRPRVRARGTLVAAERLRAAGLVTDREAEELCAAYVALRRAEHAVQNASGVQTHSVPDDPAAHRRLARALGFDEPSALDRHLDVHTSRVAALLASLLPSGAEAPSSPWTDAIRALDRGDYDRFADELEAAGMPDIDLQHGQLARDLFEISRLHPDGPLGARTRERHRAMVDVLLDALRGAADPVQAARFLRGFATRVRHPGVYTKMLADDPAAVRRLVTVLGGSAFVGEAVAARPELGDLVLFEPTVPDPNDARAEALSALEPPPGAGEPADDIESRVGRLRRAKSRITTQVALADLAGELDTRDATRTLSALADASLEVATRWALEEPGRPLTEPVRGLAVLAMGKLGGREIGYGSDLDVIFLYDGGLPIDDPVARFSRAARRIINTISMPHAEGPGYELDTRLRPSGSHGLLVVSLDAFARYHEGGGEARPRGERAATWERLALLRARYAAGDPELGTRAIEVARRAAYEQEAPIEQLATDVHHLRVRMERELARDRVGRYDLKFGPGGIVDVEFTVQLLQLEHGHDPSVRTTDTGEAIDALAEAGALDSEQHRVLSEGYAFLRKLEQRIRVLHADASHLIEEGAAGLVPLARRMGLRDEPQHSAAAILLEQLRAVTSQVRAVYSAVVVRRTAAARPSD